MNFSFLAIGFGLGLSAAAPIGPVNVAIITRALRTGAAPAFLLGCGAVTVDCLYFGAALAGTGFVRRLAGSPHWMALIQLFGGALLIWMGKGALGLAAKPVAAGVDEIERASVNADGKNNSDGDHPNPSRAGSAALASYAIGLAMTLSNPMTIIFWLSAAPGIGAQAGSAAPLMGVAGVGAGALTWVGFLVGALTLARRRISPAFMRWVNVVSGGALAGFGAVFALKAVAALTGN